MSYVASYGTVDITPNSVDSIFTSRGMPAERIADRLEANGLMLKGDDGTIFLFGLDTISIGCIIRREVETALEAGFEPREIFLAASHTHFAPAIDPDMPAFRPSAGATEEVAQQMSDLAHQIAKSNATSVSIDYYEGLADHAINRRKSRIQFLMSMPPWKRIWEMRPNSRGVKDETLRILVCRDCGGSPVAIVWSYACHPVCFPDTTAISAEFPGVVRRALRTKFGPIPVIYLQGFSGNIRPRSVRSRSSIRNFVRPVAFAPMSPMQWRNWSESLAGRVLEIIDSTPRQVTGKIASTRWQIPISELGPDGDRTLTFHRVQFGEDLTLLGMSAEVLSEYTDIVKDTIKTKSVIPVSCIDSVAGYIPTRRVIQQGGYEPERSMKVYGLSGKFRDDVEEKIRQQISQHG